MEKYICECTQTNAVLSNIFRRPTFEICPRIKPCSEKRGGHHHPHYHSTNTDFNMPAAFVNHPVSYTRCQSSSLLSSHQAALPERTPAPLLHRRHELLTAGIMHLASLQPSFSLLYLSLSVHNTGIYGLKKIHHSE